MRASSPPPSNPTLYSSNCVCESLLLCSLRLIVLNLNTTILYVCFEMRFFLKNFFFSLSAVRELTYNIIVVFRRRFFGAKIKSAQAIGTDVQHTISSLSFKLLYPLHRRVEVALQCHFFLVFRRNCILYYYYY